MKSPPTAGANENSIIHNGSRLNENLINMDHERGHTRLPNLEMMYLATWS